MTRAIQNKKVSKTSRSKIQKPLWKTKIINKPGRYWRMCGFEGGKCPDVLGV
jgi:hypothetical protein